MENKTPGMNCRHYNGVGENAKSAQESLKAKDSRGKVEALGTENCPALRKYKNRRSAVTAGSIAAERLALCLGSSEHRNRGSEPRQPDQYETYCSNALLLYEERGGEGHMIETVEAEEEIKRAAYCKSFGGLAVYEGYGCLSEGLGNSRCSKDQLAKRSTP